jgi:valyl-tRNA synthetase
MSQLASYIPKEAETRWQAEWQVKGVYQFERQSEGPVYSIDTPPPTVSGLLHLGHVYSYSQADFMARFWRMNGYNVFYPMGYDDNGLPTERLVERWRKIRASEVGRQAFIELCLQVSQEAEKEYQALWQRLGLSVDWRFTYRTIDDTARRTSQASFLDLYEKGLVYRREAPAIWCPECRTAIAQAELNDMERPSEFYGLAFHKEDGSVLPIATTRPELLPACVAVFVHPQDERYRALVGSRLQVPLSEQWVNVLADERADPQKGTGVVMCCTFGDQVDVEWWYTYHLPLVAALSPDGRMTSAAGKYAGLSYREARQVVTADAQAQGLLLERQPLLQSVRVHERCDTPVEYRVTWQWFVRVLDFKPQLLALGEQVSWRPPHMQSRYREWVENLHWDWCISRQRYFGVPFPIWYCARCGEIQLASHDQLPMDPAQIQPEAPCSCGSHEFTPENDVMDTWATSSLTPQIVGRWLTDPGLYQKVFPFALRPQAHEIIRTWAFYTLVKSWHHFGALPWKEVAISGWGLAPQGSGKISKSRGGGPVAPMALIERYSADAVRYWAASTGFGKDAMISEEKVQAGMRLVTKLWNVARFCERFIQDYSLPEQIAPLSPADRWMLARLQALITTVTVQFKAYDYASARNEMEAFFWRDLADNYLEMAKQRLYNPENPEAEGAIYTLACVLPVIVKLFAPFLPFVTEEIYQGLFADREGLASIHLSRWPKVDPRLADETSEKTGELLIGIASSIRRYKSERNLPLSLTLDRVQLGCADARLAEMLKAARSDLMSVTRADQIDIVLEPDVDLDNLQSVGSIMIAVQKPKI